jgi:hypothetical protein
MQTDLEKLLSLLSVLPHALDIPKPVVAFILT